MASKDMTATPAGKKKILPTGALELQFNEVILALSEPSGQRPSIYAYLHGGPYMGQITKLGSLEDYARHKMDTQFYWTTQLKSMTDLIERSK